jgi:hypothetical protein
MISANLLACSLAAAVKADTCTHFQHQTEEEASRHREYPNTPLEPLTCAHAELTTPADYQICSYIFHGHRNFRRLDRYA